MITGISDLTSRIKYAHEHAARIGRAEPFDICFASRDRRHAPDPGRARAELEELAAAGVTWTTLKFAADTRADFLQQVQQYSDNVLHPVS